MFKIRFWILNMRSATVVDYRSGCAQWMRICEWRISRLGSQEVIAVQLDRRRAVIVQHAARCVGVIPDIHRSDLVVAGISATAETFYIQLDCMGDAIRDRVVEYHTIAATNADCSTLRAVAEIGRVLVVVNLKAA